MFPVYPVCIKQSSLSSQLFHKGRAHRCLGRMSLILCSSDCVQEKMCSELCTFCTLHSVTSLISHSLLCIFKFWVFNSRFFSLSPVLSVVLTPALFLSLAFFLPPVSRHAPYLKPETSFQVPATQNIIVKKSILCLCALMMVSIWFYFPRVLLVWFLRPLANDYTSLCSLFRPDL